MATVRRGRSLQAQQLFGPITVEGKSATGQPVMHRMQGVPTMPGYHDRPGKWNFQDLGEKLRKVLNPNPLPSPAGD
jgi:hypothetical protein